MLAMVQYLKISYIRHMPAVSVPTCEMCVCSFAGEGEARSNLCLAIVAFDLGVMPAIVVFIPIVAALSLRHGGYFFICVIFLPLVTYLPTYLHLPYFFAQCCVVVKLYGCDRATCVGVVSLGDRMSRRLGAPITSHKRGGVLL